LALLAQASGVEDPASTTSTLRAVAERAGFKGCAKWVLEAWGAGATHASRMTKLVLMFRHP